MGAPYKERKLPHNWTSTIVPFILTRDKECRWTDKTTPCKGGPVVDHIGDRNDHSYDNLRRLCAGHNAIRTTLQGLIARGHTPKSNRPVDKHPGLR